jgi:nucleoid DNA-binding protein
MVAWPLIQEFVETIADFLDDGYTIRLRGIGVFVWKRERGRKGINIKTGKRWSIPPSMRLKWRPSARLAGGRDGHGKVRG